MTTYYTQDHEYIRVEGGTGVVGITDHAQKQLGDMVHVELPEAGKKVSKDHAVGTLESVKAAAEVYAPVSGTVVEVNSALDAEPELLNEDPSGKGWLFKIKLTDTAELKSLMDEVAYGEYLKSEGS